MRDLLDIFLEESQERLSKIASAVERLAEAKDRTPLLDEIDRELHTVKGSARMLQFAALGRLVHETETLARALRRSGAGPHDILVEAADRLSALVVECARLAVPQPAFGVQPPQGAEILGPVGRVGHLQLQIADALGPAAVVGGAAPDFLRKLGHADGPHARAALAFELPHPAFVQLPHGMEQP